MKTRSRKRTKGRREPSSARLHNELWSMLLWQ